MEDVTEERVTVSLRLRPGAVVRLDEIATQRDVSRAVVLREAVGALLNGPVARKTSDIGSAPSVAALNTADMAELRWWRAFADRTVVNGDPDRQVEPGADLAGWTFYMAPDYDEHLKAIS